DHERLRKDDIAHTLPPREIEGDAGLVLLAANRLHGTAHDLRAVSADIQPEGEHTRLKWCQRNPEQRQDEINPEQLNEYRRAAEELDVDSGERPENPPARQTPQSGNESDDKGERRAEHGE